MLSWPQAFKRSGHVWRRPLPPLRPPRPRRPLRPRGSCALDRDGPCQDVAWQAGTGCEQPRGGARDWGLAVVIVFFSFIIIVSNVTNCLEGNSLFSFLSFCPGCPVHTLSPSSWSGSWWTTWPGGFKQLHISSILGLPLSDSIFRTWVRGSIFPRWRLESCWWGSTTSRPRWPPSWKTEVPLPPYW